MDVARKPANQLPPETGGFGRSGVYVGPPIPGTDHTAKTDPRYLGPPIPGEPHVEHHKPGWIARRRAARHGS